MDDVPILRKLGGFFREDASVGHFGGPCPHDSGRVLLYPAEDR